jgi:hypothetical protein
MLVFVAADVVSDDAVLALVSVAGSGSVREVA